eukprot:m.22960 g.22960  ORF g.22960 m.22960 type:complete len:225 (-) comp8437_c0_seq3:3121-3795(-)
MSTKGKPTVKKIKDEKVASQTILKYMQDTNRPYNATDIAANLHGAIGKTLVTKTLSALAGSGDLVEKVYGKQKIYFIPQDELEKLSKEELAEADQRINDLKQEVADLEQECSRLDSALKGILQTPETADALKQVQELTAANAAKREKAEKMESATDLVTEDEKQKINKQFNTTVKEWKRRKRMANDILGQILESYPKPKKALYTDVGIETDKEVGVEMADFELV